MKKADIGLVGLAVMGENLVMNMESKGFTVAVYNRTVSKVDNFVNGRGKGKNIIGCHSLEELISQLEKPRKVFMMVKAGTAVDDMIHQLLPLLEDGDILIDGGNSHFPDTIRRTKEVEQAGKLYIGTGVSWRKPGCLASGKADLPGYLRQGCGRFSLLRLGRGKRSRPFCKNGAQWNRIWRYAAYLRGVSDHAGLPENVQPGNARGI